MKVNTLLNALVFMYIVLKPFYLWSSGLPQIADFILAFVVLMAIFYVKLPKNKIVEHNKFILVALLFVFYVTLVNFVWFIILGDEYSLIFNVLFYVFNILSMIAIILLHNSGLFKGLLVVVYKGIVASVLLQCVLYLFLGNDDPGRATNFFNNPNQLAYYALFCLSFLLIIERKIKYRTVIFIMAVLACFFLIFITLSLGAIAGALFLFVVHVFISRKKGLYKFISLSLSVFAVVFLYILTTNIDFLYYRHELLDRLLWRFERGNVSGESFIIERAYDRILNHPEYWILGAGEGAYDRFNSVANYEIHSTLGTVFFSYGAIGLLLFAAMLFYIFYKNKIIYAYPIVAIMIYGLTHNGLRNSMLWLMFALLIIASVKVNDKTPKEKVS